MYNNVIFKTKQKSKYKLVSCPNGHIKAKTIVNSQIVFCTLPDESNVANYILKVHTPCKNVFSQYLQRQN